MSGSRGSPCRKVVNEEALAYWGLLHQIKEILLAEHGILSGTLCSNAGEIDFKFVSVLLYHP